MTKTPREIMDIVIESLERTGLVINDCPAAVWARDRSREPGVTMDEMIDEAAQIIRDGKGSHHYLVAGLIIAWDEMTEDQHIKEMEYISEKGSLKFFLNKSLLPTPFTTREKETLIRLLRESGSMKSAKWVQINV